MTINARKLDRTITIERTAETLNEYGTPIAAAVWSTIATLRAQRIENASREFMRAFGEAEEGAAMFRTRYLDGITVADRITFEGEHLDIVEVQEIGRRAGLEFKTKTAQATP